MYFEELNQGDKFSTRSRVVTTTDIDNFAINTGAVNPLFLDDKFAQTIGLERRVTPGLLTLSLTIGQVYTLGLFDHLTALLSINVNFLAPVSAGDEIKSTVEAIEKRETRREDRGLVILKIECQNREAKPVMEVTRFAYLVQRKD